MNYKMKQNFENGESTEEVWFVLVGIFAGFVSIVVQKEALRKIWWAVRDSNAGPMD